MEDVSFIWASVTLAISTLPEISIDNSLDLSKDSISSISSKISPFYSINFLNKDSSKS